MWEHGMGMYGYLKIKINNNHLSCFSMKEDDGISIHLRGDIVLCSHNESHCVWYVCTCLRFDESDVSVWCFRVKTQRPHDLTSELRQTITIIIIMNY